MTEKYIAEDLDNGKMCLYLYDEDTGIVLHEVDVIDSKNAYKDYDIVGEIYWGELRLHSDYSDEAEIDAGYLGIDDDYYD